MTPSQDHCENTELSAGFGSLVAVVAFTPWQTQLTQCSKPARLVVSVQNHTAPGSGFLTTPLGFALTTSGFFTHCSVVKGKMKAARNHSRKVQCCCAFFPYLYVFSNQKGENKKHLLLLGSQGKGVLLLAGNSKLLCHVL